MDEQKSTKLAVSLEELETIRKGIQAPFVSVKHGAIGGTDCAVIVVSKDARENWPYGIFENSRCSKFFWDAKTGKLEQLTRWRFTDFRARKVKDVGTVVAKINECLAKDA